MPKVTTKITKKKLGVIERLVEVSKNLKKPLGAKLIIPTSGEDSTQNLSWVLYQEYGVNHEYIIRPREKDALSFPTSPGFVGREKSKTSLKSIGNITNLEVSKPSDIYAGKSAVPFVTHHGFPALHFIRDTLAEKTNNIETIKLQIGEEIVGIGRKPNKVFDPQAIGKILVSHVKDIKESIAEKMEILLPQKRFDDGRLFGQEPADIFRAQAKVVRAARGEDIQEPADQTSLEGVDLRRKHPLISRMRFNFKR